jgi:hypothetical protein
VQVPPVGWAMVNETKSNLSIHGKEGNEFLYWFILKMQLIDLPDLTDGFPQLLHKVSV